MTETTSLRTAVAEELGLRPGTPVAEGGIDGFVGQVGLGVIEPGKLADIIVIKGDPLFDIQALADVEVVIKDGVVLKDSAAPATTVAVR